MPDTEASSLSKAMSTLGETRFRSNPLVELQRFGSPDPELYGLFVAKPPFTMNVKSAAKETAELFASLATPARIGAALLDDTEYAADVVDLVLDGILQIESSHGFVSGADAMPLVGGPVRDATGALSCHALMHAQELETSDPQTLAMALYRYNHMPITPFWRTRFAGRDAVLEHLGANRGTLKAILEREWTSSEDGSAWLSWTAVNAPELNGDRASYKLYLSPRPECIRDAFEVLVRVLAESPASFKMGMNAADLLRPDKLVAYFATREQLDHVATRLQRELAGCDAQGVPFTATLDDSGLLSWGVDPPETERVARWLQRTSWRLWLVQRLGGALAVAKAARTPAAVEPWRFAVARIERLGVDVESWTPTAALWETA